MPSYTQLVRTVTGVPTVANFANMDGTPIVIDDSTGNAYALIGGIVIRLGGAITSTLTNSLSVDVALNNTANFFDGPSVAQGTSGTWLATGSVTVNDTAGAATLQAKLWDGTSVIASGRALTAGANNSLILSLSGVLASPAGNLRISVRDASSTSGVISANITGSGMDSTLTVLRIA